ncbi:hypothetical protein PVAP13_6NG080230 [Panicum virgatum]|uniref:Uncharacterized protein n=1 Tax=Panicum virgatum TaxID=38727 RepID=A0A8T0QVK7_PANVG|nr:hypothetical protein PVAP13_6NG080230 [Panicum virgatum]
MAATTALVSVTTGVMKPLLSKINKLLEEEYSRLKGVRKHIKFLEAELTAASSTLEVLADSEQLDPETRLWRDTLRELAYDFEDCIDAFRARVDHEPNGGNRFKQIFDKMKRLKPRHQIDKQIEELKARAIEASERRNRYKSDKIPSNSSTYSAVDPRLSALYVEVDKLVGIDGPKKHIIEWLTMERRDSSSEPKVLSIVGCGGLGKTTLANQVYQSVKSQFSCTTFVVSRNPDVKKILRDLAKGVGITNNILDDDEKQIIDKLREQLQDKRVLHDIGSTLAKNTGAEKMTAILSMSYYDIPHHLRTCLLYLSVFPEDYEIKKQCLINRWIAEGFIHEEEG